VPAKSEKREINVEVGLPESGFPKCMFFNRFRIQREKDFILLHFGMDSGPDGLVDHPLALLRSTTETQMQLIVALYEE
jgi:hypothetical protein